MDWGVVAAGVASLAGSLLASNASANQQLGMTKELQENQAKLNYQLAEKSSRNNPTWNRAGLEAAGYNPMLAVQNATSGANSSWTSGGSATGPDYASALNSAISNAQSYQRLENETKQANAIARNQNSDAQGKEIANQFMPERQRRELGQISSQTNYNNALIDNLSSRLELDRVLGFAGLDVQRKNAITNSYNAETSRKQYELDKQIQDIMRDRESRYRRWGQQHPYARNIDETLTRYFNGFGVSGSGSFSRSHLIK